jgi:hypothetical protein
MITPHQGDTSIYPSNVSVEYIDSTEKLSGMMSILHKCEEFGIDIECNTDNSFLGKQNLQCYKNQYLC